MAVDRARRLASVAPAILSVGAILTLMLVLALARAERRALAVDLGAERDLHGQPYAGSLACRRCHPDHDRTGTGRFTAR